MAFVRSEDLAASERFCRGVLGLKLIEPSPYACVYEVRGMILRVARVELAARAPYSVLGWAVEEIAAAVKWLRARGVSFRRYGGLEQDGAAIWRAARVSRGSRTPTPTRSR